MKYIVHIRPCPECNNISEEQAEKDHQVFEFPTEEQADQFISDVQDNDSCMQAAKEPVEAGEFGQGKRTGYVH